MDIKTHDLLRFEKVSKLISNTSIPDWVDPALKQALYAVVRRELIQDGLIPIGIRGQKRNERFGCFISKEAIMECITPEQLALEQEWKQKIRFEFMKETLDYVNHIFNKYKLVWGPVGSVGFEVATGFPAITEMSDLDVIIRSSTIMPVDMATELVTELSKAPIRVDVQIETDQGAISLVEYARDEATVLIRTQNGPRLISINTLESYIN